ncbi:MAG: hypothetical protein GC190_17655 [Alphaproteobacteria bacterium]|nr:hypothetical protein [Alphaproteobacteria bacterium]
MTAMRSLLLASAMVTALPLANVTGVAAKADPSFSDFFTNSKFLLDARYRYERVEQDGFANDANANTLRVRGGFQTGKVWDLQGLLELEGVAHLNDDFNDTVNGHSAFPVVADPQDFQVNRVQLEYSGIPQTVVTVGRQRINLDNQRFVGGVAWRQNEQTFDAARISNTSIENLTFTYIYLDRVNRVFGDRSSQGDFEGDMHLVNASYDIKDWGKVTGYAYLLDLNEAPALSTETFGARFAGKHNIVEGVAAIYAFEYATQSDYAANPGNFDVGYWLLEAGLSAHGVKLLGGIETLESDGVRGFSTPLATLHKFQGYADVFLTTPTNGIVDRYATLGYETKVEEFGPVTGFAAAITYHEFEADRGGASFGSEIDPELVLKFGDHWSAGVKYAAYNGDGGFADRNKLWLSIDVSY